MINLSKADMQFPDSLFSECLEKKSKINEDKIICRVVETKEYKENVPPEISVSRGSAFGKFYCKYDINATYELWCWSEGLLWHRKDKYPPAAMRITDYVNFEDWQKEGWVPKDKWGEICHGSPRFKAFPAAWQQPWKAAEARAIKAGWGKVNWGEIIFVPDGEEPPPYEFKPLQDTVAAPASGGKVKTLGIQFGD